MFWNLVKTQHVLRNLPTFVSNGFTARNSNEIVWPYLGGKVMPLPVPPLILLYICMYCCAFEFEKWHLSHVHRSFFFLKPDKRIVSFLIIIFFFQRFFSFHVLIPSKIVPVYFEIVSSPRCRLGQEEREFRKKLQFERLVLSRLLLWYFRKFCIEYIHRKIIWNMLYDRVRARMFHICQCLHFDFCKI